MAKAVSRWKSVPSGATTEQRRDLWRAINQLVIDHGGFVTSVQFASPIRIEVPMGSVLPAKLAEAGFDPAFRERTTRIGPQPSFDTFDVFHLKLPK
jgi:hypothetical protein